MSAGMADVIAAHGYIAETSQIGDYGRIEIPEYFYCQHDQLLTFDSLDEHAAHVAEELAKAGYGDVPAALLAAADEMPIETMRGSISKATVWLRQRAHSLDPEGRALVKAIHDRKAEANAN